MKTLLSLLIFSVFAFQACTPSTNDENASNQKKLRYFTKLTGIISPYLDYKPRGEITKQQTQTLSHYKVLYDEQNRIISLKYFKGDIPSNESYFFAHEVRYTYQSDITLRTYLDTDEKPKSMWRHYYFGDAIFQEKFFLDEKGNKSKLILLDSLGNQVASGLGSFTYTFETLDDKTFIQKQFKQDGTPNVLTQYFPFEISKISTDDLGHLYAISNVNEEGKLVMQETAGFAEVIFDFDQFGNEMAWRFYDTEKQLANRKPFQNMDYGYAQWVYTVDWKDQKLGLANSLYESYSDTNNEPIENNFGIYQTKYSLDEGDNIVSISYWNKSLEKHMHQLAGFHQLFIDYDETGNPVKRTKMDTEGNVLEM